MEMDDEAFARMLQQQLLDEERMLEAQQVQQQQSIPARAPEPPSEVARPAQSHPDEDEDPDLALARRMQELERMGMGNQNSQRFGSSAGAPHPAVQPSAAQNQGGYGSSPSNQGGYGSSSSNQGGYSSHAESRTSRREQEEEDARLARRLAESGQSLRDLDLKPAPPASHTGRMPPQQYPSINEREPEAHPHYEESPHPSSAHSRESRPQPQPVYRNRAHEAAKNPPNFTSPTQEFTPAMPPKYAGGHKSGLNDRSPMTGMPSMSRDEPSRAPTGGPRSAASPNSASRGTERGPLDQDLLKSLRSPMPRKQGRPPIEPPMFAGDVFLDVPSPKKKEKKKKVGLLGIFGRNNGGKDTETPGNTSAAKADKKGGGLFGRGRRGSDDAADEGVRAGTKKAGGDEDEVSFKLPEPVSRPADTIGAAKGPLPYSLTVSRDAPELSEATVGSKSQLPFRKSATCAICGQPAQNPLNVLDKKIHSECFRCVTCHELIDPAGAFAYIENNGDKQPMHRKCYAEIFGIKCCVCEQSIPAGPDGKVSFVKHPFFDTEQMCPSHARNLTRRCTGCHRFEPEIEPFAELNDVGRCVCMSCCRSVVVDSHDAQPLWAKVVDFFEHKLSMPIWKDFREVPILVVGYNALNDQMNSTSNVHGGASQIMTRGLCLTEHESGRRFKMSRQKYDQSVSGFVTADVEDRGFTYFQVPDASKVNPDASVTAILCLSGLPRDLTASILAHEATHAWIKMHPQFNFERPIPPQVEEGCAQLVALLFLNEGLDEPQPLHNNDGSGPSDEKLRQYFRFSIETDDHEVYGTGYRRAAMAYSKIGIEALMSHIVRYGDFPEI
jgi:hypothetical protein